MILPSMTTKTAKAVLNLGNKKLFCTSGKNKNTAKYQREKKKKQITLVC